MISICGLTMTMGSSNKPRKIHTIAKIPKKELSLKNAQLMEKHGN